MQVLIFLRDFFLAVLLSWIGADQPAETDKDKKEHSTASISLTSGECATPVMLLRDDSELGDMESYSELFAS